MDFQIEDIYSIYLTASRWVLAILAIIIAVNWVRQYRFTRYYTRVFGALVSQDGARIPIVSCESAIGRRRVSDILLPLPSVSRTHAVLTKTDNGWKISDTRSSGGVLVNGIPLEGSTSVYFGDMISIGDEVELQLTEADKNDVYRVLSEKKKRDIKGVPSSDLLLLVLLTAFQTVLAGQFILRDFYDLPYYIPLAFSVLIVAEWIYYFCIRGLKHSRMLIEIPVFFLTTLGISVCITSAPGSVVKQLIAIAAGFVCYALLCRILVNIELVMKLRYVAAAAAVTLFALNVLFGSVINGAQNWIDLGFITFQPSELVKVMFIFAGAATLERLLTYRNLRRFLLLSVFCMGVLAYTRDFGTLAIFFVTMMIIIIMRLGDMRIVTGITAAMVVLGAAVAVFVPYVSQRFESWGRAWDFADTSGYQQTRTLIYSASGGLLGLGGGNGHLKDIVASDTDLVFGVLCEELGLIVAFAALSCFVMIALYSYRLSKNSQSSYYSISVCAAAGMFLFQAALNAFGATDILPLTGVTMPFVSNGGTSIVACFCILAFFKAAELKQITDMDD